MKKTTERFPLTFAAALSAFSGKNLLPDSYITVNVKLSLIIIIIIIIIYFDLRCGRYGLKVECGSPSNRHKSLAPDACFFFADNLLVIDHSNDDVYILSIRASGHPSPRAARQSSSDGRTWLEETEKKLRGLIYHQAKGPEERKARRGSSGRNSPRFLAAKSRVQYMKDVERCLEFIRDGESYELCLTTQMKMRAEGVNALGAYYDLRERNPAPYAAWLNFSEENLCILCSSPERFLRLDGDGTLEAKPIKGTAARGSTMEEDRRLMLQLQNRCVAIAGTDCLHENQLPPPPPAPSVIAGLPTTR